MNCPEKLMLKCRICFSNENKNADKNNCPDRKNMETFASMLCGTD